MSLKAEEKQALEAFRAWLNDHIGASARQVKLSARRTVASGTKAQVQFPVDYSRMLMRWCRMPGHKDFLGRTGTKPIQHVISFYPLPNFLRNQGRRTTRSLFHNQGANLNHCQ